MRKLYVYLKGILLGFVSLAIPGLSASTMALEVDIYYDMIDAISNIFKKFKKSIVFLVFLILGYITGGYIGAISVSFAYAAFPLAVVLLIMGFVFGGMPQMLIDAKCGIKKPSCLIVFAIVCTLLVLYSYVVTEGEQITFDNLQLKDYIILFFVGIITASTLVIPGVDFAVLFLAMGYYNAFIDLIADLPNIYNFVHNITILGVYIAGYSIGTFAFSKLINILIKKYPYQTQFASLAFVVASPSIVIRKCCLDNPGFYMSTGQWIVGGVLFVIGFSLVFYLSRLGAKKNVITKGEIQC